MRKRELNRKMVKRRKNEKLPGLFTNCWLNVGFSLSTECKTHVGLVVLCTAIRVPYHVVLKIEN